MKHLLKVASILDESGHYELSDKLYKIAQNYDPNISASDLANEVRGIITIDPGIPGSYQNAMEKLRQNPNLKVVTEWRKDSRYYLDREYLNKPGTTKNTSESGLYVPPVEFYEGVDKRHYNDYRAPGSKSYNEMMMPRMKNMPQNLSGTAVMDGSMYLDNPYTPKDILKLRNTLVPTNLREDIRRSENDAMMNSYDPQSFTENLWEFARRNNTSSSLVNSFDAFADAGAMYKGKSIKDVPELKELYKIIRNSPRMFSMTEISKMFENIYDYI